jgi:hypothetical protein
MPRDIQFFTGLDFGQAREFSAVAVLEKTYVPVPEKPHTAIGHYAVRFMERFPSGTPYGAIYARLAEVFREKPLSNSILVVDQTAVGKPVIDLLRQSGIRARIRTLAITAGHQSSHHDSSGMLVPKKELVGSLQVLFQCRRLRVANELQEAALLMRELNNFQMKVVIPTLDTQVTWREGVHDDLVLAVAIAAWEGERHQPAAGFTPYVTPSGAWFQSLR